MANTLVTGPSIFPVTLDEAKSHLRVDTNDDNTLIDRIISAATSIVEKKLQRKLITQTWKMFLDAWPCEIKVLFGDLQSVTHVKYTDADEVQDTLSADVYLIDTDSVPGRIILADGESWPSDILSRRNPIEIQFVTGYGDATTDVEEDIRHAIFLTIAHYYEFREPFVAGTIVSTVPMGVDLLLNKYIVWEWGM